MDSPLLTIQEVARILRVDESTVRRWIRNGELQAYMFPPNAVRQSYRIHRSELERFAPGLLAKCEQQQE